MSIPCWRDQAACRDVVTADYDPFFADSNDLQVKALAICITCPVRDDCLTFAVRTGQQYGIWGRAAPADSPSADRAGSRWTSAGPRGARRSPQR